MNVKLAKRAAVVAGIAAVSVSLVAGPALADPPTTTPPTFRQLVGVGSDTTQDVINYVANNTVVDPNNSPDHWLIASYNATKPGTTPPVTHDLIQTRSGHASIQRPNGSSEGITALVADIASGAGNLDFARSSRGPADVTTADLTWVPFAVDALAPSVRSDSPLASYVFSTAPGLTDPTSELRKIYTCTETSITVGGTAVALHPLLPQAGSGSRSFWLKALGLTETTKGACVSDRSNTVEENSGGGLQTAGDILPFSIASWIAQSNGASTDRRQTTTPAGALASLNSVKTPAGVTQAPIVSSKLNTSFPITREVYNVFKTSRLTETDIKNTFVGSTSKFCATGGAVATQIVRFGFALDGNCGSTTLTGKN